MFNSNLSHAQSLVNEDFTGYSTGNLATQGGWTKAGTGPDAAVANASPLTYSGYNGGGGNYVQIPASSNTTSNVRLGFTLTSSGTNTIYYSFLLNLSSATATGDYFLSLADPTTGTNYFAKVFARTSAAGYNIGISKGAGTGTYGSSVLNFNQTYLIVARVSFIAGSSNDEATVWVNPSPVTSEPVIGSAESTISSGSDFTGTVGNIVWHNRSLNNPVGKFDGLKVAVGSTSRLAWANLGVSTTPFITSSLTANAVYGVAASTYTITASNSPTSYAATGLPPGLSINTSTGQITGTPTSAAGSPYNVSISATNANGTGSTTLVYTINPTCITTGTVNWNFGTSTGTASPSSSPITNLTVSDISQGNNNGTTTMLNNGSVSNTYTSFSAAYNAEAATRNGALNTAANGSAYFEFTLTPNSAYSVSLTGISFGSRSTGTGPQAYSLRSSLDNYASDIATGSLPNNAAWILYAPTIPTPASSAVGAAITYRIYGYGGAGAVTNTAVWRIDDLNLTVALSTSVFTWTGTSSTNWNDSGNWSCNNIPGNAASDVIISSSATNMPSLGIDVSIRDLNLSGTSTLTLNGHTLTVNGVVSGTGKLIGSASSNLVIAGSGASSLVFDQTSSSTRVLNNYTQSGNATVTLTNPLNIVGNLNLTGGSSIFASGGNLTMLSTATTSSNIGSLTGTADITGNVNVQSYLTGGALPYRGTRSMSSPINDAGLASKTYAQLKNSILITGPQGGGFDTGGSLQPYAVTLNLYSEPALPATSFIPVSNIANSATPGQGFLTFFRGDRLTNLTNKLTAPFANPEPVTLTYTGPINKGDIQVNLSYTNNSGDTRNGFNLIGNPYASTIDWSLITKTASVIDQTYTLIPGGGTAVYDGASGIGTNGATKYIQPGQGFYIICTSTGQSITFTESSKGSNSPARLLSTPEVTQIQSNKKHNTTHVNSAPDLIRLNLQDSERTDETIIAFKEGDVAEADSADAPYFSGSTVSLGSLSSDDKIMAINHMPDINQVSQVKLNVGSAASGNVKLNFTDLTGAGYLDVILQDDYLNTQTDVKINPVYNFNINTKVATSFGANRFKLLFQPPVVLPLQLTGFTVKKANGGAELNWSTSSEKNNDRFELERSTDGKVFEKIAQVKGGGNSLNKLSYSFTDKNPANGTNYYRLKQVDLNGKYTYSNSLTLEYNLSADNSKLILYPNPVVDEIILDLKNNNSKTVIVCIIDAVGKCVKSSQVNTSELIRQHVANLNSGVYFLEVSDSFTKNLIGRSKFLKQ